MSKWGGYSAPKAGVTEVQIIDKALELADKSLEINQVQFNQREFELQSLKDKLVRTEAALALSSNTIATLHNDNNRLSNELREARNSLHDVKCLATNSTLDTESYFTGGIVGDSRGMTRYISSPESTSIGYIYNKDSIGAMSFKDATASEKEEPTGLADEDNAMAYFVEFLNENEVLDLFIEALEEAGVSFEELAMEIAPSDYIAYGTTGTSNNVADGWEEADKLWQKVVHELGINEMEAVYE